MGKRTNRVKTLLTWLVITAQIFVLLSTATLTAIQPTPQMAQTMAKEAGLGSWIANTAANLVAVGNAFFGTPKTALAESGSALVSASGARFSCALNNNNGVQCWGANNTGQLGNGTTGASLVPVQVTGLTSGVIDIAATDSSVCALMSNGGVKCWGNNSLGQLGNRDATLTASNTPVDVYSLQSGVVALDGGSSHMCALLTTGGVKCWGNNSNGQIGDGAVGRALWPVDVLGLRSGVAAVSAGSLHTCAVLIDGTAKCWGDDTNGTLGNTGSSSETPVTVAVDSSGTPLTGLMAISAGVGQTCGLLTTGGLKCWGVNAWSQLGNNSTASSSYPVNVSGLSSGVAAVSAGNNMTCAVLANGSAQCWGLNNYGQLGDGTITNRSTPVSVSGLSSGVANISTSLVGPHACVALAAGGVRCWGYNGHGQLGNNTLTNSSSPITVSGVTGLAVNTPILKLMPPAGFDFGAQNLTIASTARTATIYNASGAAASISSISLTGADAAQFAISGGTCGTTFPLALAAGNTCTIQVTFTPTSLGGKSATLAVASNAPAVSVPLRGVGATVGTGAPTITSDGGLDAARVSVFENGTYVTAITAQGASPFTFGVFGGADAALFTTDSSGNLRFINAPDFEAPADAGNNNSYEVTVAATNNVDTDIQDISVIVQDAPDTLNSIVSVSTYNSCVVTSGGTVKCWGGNSAGQIGDGTNTQRALPTAVSGLSGVKAVAIGNLFACALTSAGSVQCWGENSVGQLGNGSTVDSNVPVQVQGLTSGVVAIDAGANYMCVLTSAGGVKCWGGNAGGQLGSGGTGTLTTPADVTGLTSGVAAISAGTLHSCAVLTNGTAKCWGDDSVGALGNTGSSSSTPVTVVVDSNGVAVTGLRTISAGAYHTCAATATGAVKCWGAGGEGQLGIGTSANNSYPVNLPAFPGAVNAGVVGVATLSAGNLYTCAVLANSTAQCWGYNSYAQIGDGTSGPSSIPVSFSGLSGGVVAISTGTNTDAKHTCAVTNNGAIKCIGYNPNGQLGTGLLGGTLLFNSVPYPVMAGDGSNPALAPTTPIVGLSPASPIAFGTQAVLVASAPQTITLSNSGATPLTVNSMTATGGGGSYAISGGTCGTTYPLIVNAGSSCTVQLTFTPVSTGLKIGTLTVSSDSGGQPTTSTYSLTGTGVAATVPVITSNGGGATASVSIAENSTAVTTVTASGTTPLTFSLVGGADQAKFTINSTTGVLTFASAPDFETPTDSGANNVYDVTVRVSNSSGTDDQAIAVTVTDVAEGAPNLTIGKSGPATAVQGTNFNYTLVVTNTGTTATSGTVTVADTLPAGLSFVSGSGGGFTCSAAGQVVTCTSSTAIAVNGKATILLAVNPTTTGVKANTASVSGGGDTSSASSNTVNTTVNAAPTSMVVNTTADNTTAGDSNCTLREAMTNANNNNDTTGGDCAAGSAAGTDSITFNIPGAGPHTIAPTSALPTLTGATSIDGSTQPSASCGPTRNLLIVLNGASAGASANGLNLAATVNGFTLRGLVINGFTANGINVNSADNGVIECNNIGTNAAGTAALPNTQHGVFITAAAANNRIGTNGDGTADAGERNLIAGNGVGGFVAAGVYLNGTNTVSNVVAGNYIGTDLNGTAAITNTGPGVWIASGAANNRIGTDGNGTGDAAERNLISGNNSNGVYILGASNNNIVAGNYIGTNAAGTAAIPNKQFGVDIINGASGNRVGTDGNGVGDAEERNLISGNAYSGLAIQGSYTVANVVAGNYIGTNAAGTAALPNTGGHGIYIGFAATNTRIGTNGDGVGDAAERNLISGNPASGVALSGVGTTGNVIAGNYLGTDVNGTAAIGNAQNGAIIKVGAANNRIGTNGDGTGDAAERNLISGNGGSGVVITGTNIVSNVVAGNYIGSDVNGTAALPNTGHGVFITNGAANNRIGSDGNGTGDAAERNLISGNGAYGVVLLTTNTTGNVVAGNYIGTDVNGTAAIKNTLSGVRIEQAAANNRIGTNGDGSGDTAERNLISGNGGHGLSINGTNTSSNVVAGNYIGTNAAGTAALGNTTQGVRIDNGASNNRIGTNGDGTGDAAERNLISGNNSFGIAILDASTTGNVVAGNYIGTDVNGTAALGNTDAGITFQGTPANNRIGGTIPAQSNLIANNAVAGIQVLSNAGNDNAILGNSIFNNTGLGIDLGAGGVTPNDVGDADTGGNDLLNHPVIRSVSGTTVNLYSDVPAGNYLLQIYDNPGGLDATKYGEGETLVYSGAVAISAGGMNHSATLAAAPSNSGQRLAATLTEDLGGGNYGSTSEFSGPDAIATADSVSAVVNSTGNVFNVVANDRTFWYTDTLSVLSVGTPTGGTVTGFSGNNVTYSAPASPGSYTFSYVVKNSAGITATATVAVNVTAVVPTITSSGGGATAAISIPENTTVVTTVTASGTAPIAYSIVGGADAAKFTINATTGALSFVAAPDFETPTDGGGNNVYDVTVRASNSAGTDDQIIAVTVTNVAESAQGIEYKLVYNAALNRYEVWMRSTVTPGAPKTTGTAQVTIKAPHVIGSGIFTPTNITAQVANTAWAVTSRTNGPAADTSADYLSFSLDFPTNAHTAINWQAGQEILMYTFQNGGVCAGAVSLMENNDGFNVAPNNPGQQIDVFALANDPGNDFIGNYNLGQGDCDRDGDGVVNGTDLDDDGDGLLDSVEGALTVDTDSDGIPDGLDLDSDGDGIADNIEAQSTAGYLAPGGSDSDGDGLDNAYEGAGNAGLTPVNTDGADNPDYKDTDSDNAQGNDTTEAGLTKSNADADKDGIDDGIDSNDSAFGPVNAGVTAPATAYPNSNSTGDVDYRDSVTTAPDLTTTIGQPTPSLMVGVQSNLPVVVANQGTAPTSGPITTTITLPTGISAPVTFGGGNGWSCTTSGQSVTCVKSGAINNGSSSTLLVPVVATTAGSTVTFNATTAPTSGEGNTSNNGATPLTTTTATVAFVNGCFNTTVTLNGAQQVPSVASAATGTATVLVNTIANTLDYSLSFSGLTPTMGHIHGFAPAGVNAGIVHNLPGVTSPQVSQWSFSEGDQANILGGLTYFNLHSAAYGGGEIRGQIGALAPVACASLSLPIKVMLGGAYQSSNGLMRATLRTLPDFPLVSPYGDGATISNRAVLTANNIVDWVLVELHSSAISTTVVMTQAGLLQNDGDLVGVDGSSALQLSGVAAGNYYVALKHRNHLGVMTAAPMPISSGTALLNLTQASTPVYGTYGRQINSTTGVAVLWPGDANQDGKVITAGPNNDRNQLLRKAFTAPGNSSYLVNYIVKGYYATDLNLDGSTLASGPGNDDNIILTTVFLHPNNANFAANFIVNQQMP